MTIGEQHFTSDNGALHWENIDTMDLRSSLPKRPDGFVVRPKGGEVLQLSLLQYLRRCCNADKAFHPPAQKSSEPCQTNVSGG
jgi:hypothetical protein